MRLEIKRVFAAFVLVLVAGCAVKDAGTSPPIDRFHYPVSVAVLQDSPTSEGTLYVVNSNFDLRFNRGWVTAVDVGSALANSTLNCPAGVASCTGPLTATTPENVAFIGSFAGQIATYQPVGATPAQRRLFVPTRELSRLSVLTADGMKLSCLEPTASSPADCVSQGVNLVESESKGTIDPFGVEIHAGQVFVAPLHRAIPPGQDIGNAWMSILDAEKPDTVQLLDIGAPPSEAIVGTSTGLYLSGRSILTANGASSQMLRFLPITGTPPELGAVADTSVTDATRIQESRGLAVSSDRTRLFVSTRGPDSSAGKGLGPDGLLVLDITTDPAHPRVLSFEPLPRGPSSIVVLPRTGRRDVVAISCTDGNKVAFWDDELGQVVSLADVNTPSGLAQAIIPATATSPVPGRRVFVASFEGHTVAVFDFPNFDSPTQRLPPIPPVRTIGAGVD